MHVNVTRFVKVHLPWNRYTNPAEHDLALETHQLIRVNGGCSCDMAHYLLQWSTMLTGQVQSSSASFMLTTDVCGHPASTTWDEAETATNLANLCRSRRQVAAAKSSFMAMVLSNPQMMGWLGVSFGIKLYVISVGINPSSKDQGFIMFYIVGFIMFWWLNERAKSKSKKSVDWLSIYIPIYRWVDTWLQAHIRISTSSLSLSLSVYIYILVSKAIYAKLILHHRWEINVCIYIYIYVFTYWNTMHVLPCQSCRFVPCHVM